MTKIDKYDNNIEQESISDIEIFIPISDTLIPYIYYCKITPNQITILSTLSTIFSVYLFFYNNYLCLFYYFLGYLLDTIDGRLARKYNMVSILGMILDLVSDNISNIPLLIVFFMKSMFSYFKFFLFLLVLTFLSLFNVSYAINESIISYNKKTNENFYFIKKEIISKSEFNNTCIGNIFLLINKTSYYSYKLLFKEKISKKNIQKLKYKLSFLKEFGPGNLNIFITIIMFIFLIF